MQDTNLSGTSPGEGDPTPTVPIVVNNFQSRPNIRPLRQPHLIKRGNNNNIYNNKNNKNINNNKNNKIINNNKNNSNSDINNNCLKTTFTGDRILDPWDNLICLLMKTKYIDNKILVTPPPLQGFNTQYVKQ